MKIHLKEGVCCFCKQPCASSFFMHDLCAYENLREKDEESEEVSEMYDPLEA